MPRWLKWLLFAVWGLALIPPLAPALERALKDSAGADRDGLAATVLHGEVVTAAFGQLRDLSDQRWFNLALVFLTGLVIGVALEWLGHRSGATRASALRSIGIKFRALSDSIRIRTVAPGWPDNVRDLQPAIRAVLSNAWTYGLWVPDEHVFQLPDATFLCEYFRSVGRLLEDGDFAKARSEAQSWQPYFGHPTAPRQGASQRHQA
jgi:hypothetical protein